MSLQLKDDEACLLVEDVFEFSGKILSAIGKVTEAGPEATHLLDSRTLLSLTGACGGCATCRRGLPSSCPTTKPHQLVEKDGERRLVFSARWAFADVSLPAPAAVYLAGPMLQLYTLASRTGLAAGDELVICGNVQPWYQAALALAEAKGAKVIDNIGEARKPIHVWILDARAFSAQDVPAGSTIGLLSHTKDTGVLQQSATDLAWIAAKDCTLVGCNGSHPDLLPELVALASKGHLQV